MDTPDDNAGSSSEYAYSYLLEKLLELFPDDHGEMIYCRNKEKGCEWMGEVNDLEDHLEKSNGCQYVDVRCPDCNTELERHQLIDHVNIECPVQIVDCQFCFTTGTRQFIEGQHKFECFVSCPNTCGIERISGEDLDEHKKICPSAIVQCDYHGMGCECGSMVRRDMEVHTKENVTEHLLLTRNFLDKTAQEYQDFKEQHDTFVLETDMAIRDLERKMQQITLKNFKAEEQINELEKQLKAMKQKGAGPQSHDVRSWLSISWDGDDNVQAFTCTTGGYAINSIPVLPVYVKMSGFDKHRRTNTSWYSDSFLSHKGGYTMCLQVKASGLGSDVKDVYVSVLLHLMKGQHDNELPWPITKTFYIKLLNQISNTNHWVRYACFATASNELISTRVTGDYEMSYYGRGCFDYIPIKKISKIKPTCQYVKDDSIIFVIEQSPLELDS